MTDRMEPTMPAALLDPNNLPQGTFIGWVERIGPGAPRKWHYGVIIKVLPAAYQVEEADHAMKFLRRHPAMLEMREVYAVRDPQEQVDQEAHEDRGWSYQVTKPKIPDAPVDKSWVAE